MAQLVLALLAMSALASVLLVRYGRRRAKARRWLPLHDAMCRNAATLPSTYLAQILTRPEPEAGGQVMATDLLKVRAVLCACQARAFRPVLSSACPGPPMSRRSGHG